MQRVAPEALQWSPLPEPPVTTVSATALAHGTEIHGDKDDRRDERGDDRLDGLDPIDGLDPLGASAAGADPARRKAATTLGTAVHWVLEHVSFDQPQNVERLATTAVAAVTAGAVADDPATRFVTPALVAELANVALTAPVVAAAAGVEHWRELYVAVPGATRQLEGYVDLVVRRPDGLVVVDFKTDAVVPAGDEPAPSHRLQLAAYAHALGAAAGEPVVGAVAVYCRDAARPERWVADLDAAIGEVIALLDS